MLLNFATEAGDSYALDLDPTMELENVAALLEAESQIPAQDLLLIYKSQHITDMKATLESIGVKNDDMVLMRRKENSTSGQQTTDSSLEEIDAVRRQLVGNQDALSVMRQSFPELANAAVSGDNKRFGELLPQIQQRQEEAARTEQRNTELLNADPFDVNAQAQIEEAIRQQRVMENMAHAVEYSPESFGIVTMLYVAVEVNGTPVKAFVDSGAQSTIMSPELAEKCGIMRLIDKRFAGIARGVGTAKILGRVHSAQIKVGSDLFLPCSFTIMENRGVDLLFGLDMLKRHQACLDLQQNALIIQGRHVPFLPEHEIPKNMMNSSVEVDQDGNPIIAPNEGLDSSSISTDAQQSAGTPSKFPGAGNTLSSAGSGAATSTSSASRGTSAPTSSNNKFSDSLIEGLTNLGVTREEAIRMLEATGGNAEQAASLLFSQLDNPDS